MLTDLEKGDVAETIATFFEASKHVQPAPKAKAVRIISPTLFLQSLNEHFVDLGGSQTLKHSGFPTITLV
jgi:hypothetical protein